MKKMTAMAAALAAACTSFAAYAQPQAPKSTKAAENVSANDTAALPGVWGANSTLLLTASHGMTAHKGKAKHAAKHSKHSAGKHTKRGASKHAKRVKVVLDTRRGGQPQDVDMMQTASISGGATDAQFSKAEYSTIVSRYASAYGVPVALAHAVISVESNYRANARGGAGEIGLMQIKPSTARMMGYNGGSSGLFNPETNIKYGMKYLAMAHSLGGGDTCGTILKYNAGHGAKRMNPVSAAYCSKVKQRLAMN
jgi:soluble lytic murein transglycosylase-like protein